jgi:hypothetical protein
MSGVSSLLRNGWENIWKNKILWGFGFLVLIQPIIRLVIPVQKSVDFPSSLFNLLISIIYLYLMYMSDAGVSFVAYCIATCKPVNAPTAYQASKKLFWRVVAVEVILLLFAAPCFCTVFVLTYNQPRQVVDFAHSVFFTSIPLSVFAAMQYFVITEMIANRSRIGESLKAAWAVFTHNFATLAMIGFLLSIAAYMVNVSICAAVILAQNSFDLASLSQLDFISPYLSLTGNNFYLLVNAIVSTILRTYSASVFTVAYLKYSGAE